MNWSSRYFWTDHQGIRELIITGVFFHLNNSRRASGYTLSYFSPPASTVNSYQHKDKYECLSMVPLVQNTTHQLITTSQVQAQINFNQWLSLSLLQVYVYHFHNTSLDPDLSPLIDINDTNHNQISTLRHLHMRMVPSWNITVHSILAKVASK